MATAAELRGFLAYLKRCDVIHCHELVSPFEALPRVPRQGEIYNMGGGLHHHTSLTEAVSVAQKITGEATATGYQPANLVDYHIWWWVAPRRSPDAPRLGLHLRRRGDPAGDVRDEP